MGTRAPLKPIILKFPCVLLELQKLRKYGMLSSFIVFGNFDGRLLQQDHDVSP